MHYFNKLIALLFCAAVFLWVPACFANPTKTIYLTFDDGPINVTHDVVNVLNQNNIKATFFLNGIHLFGKGGENEDKSIDSLVYLLKSGHVIGNHSYDHMMGYHNCEKDKVSPEFFTKYCSDQSLRTYSAPTTDIVFFNPLNTQEISKIIKDNFGINHKLSNDHLNDLIRMPFTNNWRVHAKGFNPEKLTGNAPCATTDDKYVWDYTAEDFNACLTKPTKSAQHAFKLADLLAEKGYQVFGWDIEWAPSNWGAEYPAETLMTADQLAKYTEQSFDVCMPHTVENPMQDRAPDLNCASPLHKNKSIILAHDFLFETGSRGNGGMNLVELDKFIKLMKSKGYQFDTLDHYTH